MSKFSFVSNDLTVHGVLAAKIETVGVVDGNTQIVLDTNKDIVIDLGVLESDTDLKEGLSVEIEALTHPKNMFILTTQSETQLVVADGEKKAKSTGPKKASPARGSIISNGWDM